jgi:tRNA1(Val) A37 N6-methylase TrmN6
VIGLLPLKNAVNISHILLEPFLGQADVLVDMTCGNGHDTVFLASHMKKTAQLYAFDIQQCAIENTRAAIENAGLAKMNIMYALGSHDKMLEKINNPIDVVVFNLGYLPSGDHELHTNTEITVKACKICLNKIAKNGIIIMVAYPGTDAGKNECLALQQFLRQIPQDTFHVSKWNPLNQVNDPPVLYVIQKR